MKALIIVDMQYDFCEGGSLAVAGGNALAAKINEFKAANEFGCVVLTSDWHPANHRSFHSNNPGEELFKETVIPETGKTQMMWPNHCVQNSHGAGFHEGLEIKPEYKIIRKGQMTLFDSYSGFGCDEENTGLKTYLEEKEVTHCYVVGLCYDYCVGYTALDAVKLGFETVLITDLSASVADQSKAQMTQKLVTGGVTLLTTSQLNL